MHKVQQLFHVNSFQEIIETSKEIHKNLKSLGCFKKVNMSVDTMPEDPTHYKVNITVCVGHRTRLLGLSELGSIMWWGRGKGQKWS